MTELMTITDQVSIALYLYVIVIHRAYINYLNLYYVHV